MKINFLFVVFIIGITAIAVSAQNICTTAKNFELRDQLGDLTSLNRIVKSTKNKLILLNIFQTTCGPCLEEIEYLS